MGALTDLTILPGFFTIKTDRGSRNRWKTGNHVRFFNGQPMKLGGWVKASATAFLGKCRSAKDFQSLTQVPYIGMGTHLKLYVYNDGTFYDITPIRLTTSPMANNSFATSSGTPTITVTDAAHGAATGDYVTFTLATAVAGVTLNGEWAITVTGVNTYTFTANQNASSSTSGGGAAAIANYQISIGTADASAGLGWGSGAWGATTFGVPRAGTTFIGLPRIWSLDNWGEDLIACPRGGGIYVWDTSTGTGTRATIISGIPATNKAIIVSELDRHLISLGAHNGSTDDPLLIRWSDSEDYTAWTPSESNTAGRKRLDGGNEIYCAVKVAKEIAVFTDTTLTAMIYSGPPYTFDFVSRGLNYALVGPNAVTVFDGKAFWMGKKNFYNYDGRVRLLPCDVRNYVFDDFNADQQSKVWAGVNSVYGEVWWLYPSSMSSTNDRYVIYNARENSWVFGTIARTTIVGDSKLLSAYAHGEDNYLYSHENGVDDNVSELPASLSSWDVEIGDGAQVMLVSRFVPDFKTLTGSVTLTLNGKSYPQAGLVSQPVGSIDNSTKVLNPHMRARQISIALASAGIGNDWQIGTMRIDAQTDGEQ